VQVPLQLLEALVALLLHLQVIFAMPEVVEVTAIQQEAEAVVLLDRVVLVVPAVPAIQQPVVEVVVDLPPH
jgi:hypothetical protein